MASAPLRQRAGSEFAIERRERIVERVHIDAAHGVDDERARAVLGLDHGGAAPRRTGGIIERPDQPRRALDENQRLFLIPGMIAQRDRVDAGLDQLAIDRLGDAEAAGRILAIGDDQIELPVADQLRQALDDRGSPAPPDNVADEKNAHAQPFIAITSRSVSTRSSRASRSVDGTVETSCIGEGDADGGYGFALNASAQSSYRNSRRHSRCAARCGRRQGAAPIKCRDRLPARRLSARGCPIARHRAARPTARPA